MLLENRCESGLSFDQYQGWFELFNPKKREIKPEQTALFWEKKYHGRNTLESWNGYRLINW